MRKLQQYIDWANGPKWKQEFESFKEDLFVHTLFWEGGSQLHKVKGDSGGYTIYGIAYNYNKDLFRNLADFKDTVYAEAAAVAFCRYYLPAEVYRVPEQAKLMYFDMCYNMGTVRGIKIMQKCAGTPADGVIGDFTRPKMYSVTEKCLYHGRVRRYYYLVGRNSKLRKFIKGWLNRTNDILVRNDDLEVAA